jgi:hypothetical protein
MTRKSLRAEDVKAVSKMYDFILWVLPHLENFPRSHRFTLSDRLEHTALDILELLIEAAYAREKSALLTRANVQIEKLHFLVRLAKDLHLLSIGAYEQAAKMLHEVASLLGGWLKQQQRKHQ